MILVSVSYLVFMAFIIAIEHRRVRRQNKFDFLTLFWIMFILQAVVPPLIVTAILGLHGNMVSTGVGFYDRVLRAIDPSVAFGTLLLSVLFWATVCASWFALKKPYIGREWGRNYRFAQTLMVRRWIVVMTFGVVLMFFLLDTAGGGITAFENLVLLRGGTLAGWSIASLHVFYGFTQAFAFISVLGVARYAARRNYLRMTGCLALALFFGVMTVSRRAILLEFVLLYFAYVLLAQRLRLKYLFIIGLLSLPIVLFGKTALNVFSATGVFSLSGIVNAAPEQNAWTALLRIFADIGRTVTDSWATFLYLNLPPRFGVDHILSLVRLFNGNTLGLNLNLPERIVRISTAAFISPLSQDEPPGLMGQMWLDFRVFGPLVWGVTLAFQLATLQRIYNRCRKTPEVVALYAVLLYMVSLVINSGSYDFTFSVGWVVFVLLSLLVCRTRQLVPSARGAVAKSLGI